MSPREVVPAIRKIMREELPPVPYLGIVRRVAGTIADVQLAFSNRYLRDVPLLRGTDLTVGDEVLLMRANIEARWVVIGCVQSRSRGTPGGGSGVVVVPSPSSMAVTARETYIEVAWDASLLDSVNLYEVMHNSSASETGATTIAVRLSQYDYHAAIGTTRHFRVRAVGTDYRRSGWTAWASATVARHDPEDVDDHSADAAEMQESTDPGEAGSESLATTLTEELKRLRGMWAKLRSDGLEWYEAIDYLSLSGDFECGNYSDIGADPRDGQWYWTLDTNKLYVGDACAWVDVAAGGGGASTFLSLTDTPAAYGGEALKIARVNAGEAALEFVAHTLDHDHTGDAGDGGQISHDTALTGISADDHHAEAHAADHKDGGAQELDVSELAGALGAAGEIPETDGAAVTWVDPDGRYTPPDHAHAGLVGDGGVFPHANLSELQGGVIGERCHLDEAEHSALTDSPDLIFNEADGLLLLDFQRWEQHGSGAARANYIIGSRLERARVGINNAVAGSRGALHFEPGRWQNTRALVVEEATTNICTNPSLEANTTNWAASGGNTPTIARDTSEAHRGAASLKITTTAGPGGNYWDAIALNTGSGHTFTLNEKYTISFWAKASQAVTIKVYLQLNHAAWTNVGVTDQSITTEWKRFEQTITWSLANDNDVRAPVFGLGFLAAGINVWVDEVQVEEKDCATTYCDGSLGDGYGWSGTAHASTSNRVRSYGVLTPHVSLVSGNDTLSFRAMWQPLYDASGTWPEAQARLFEIKGADNNNRILVYFDTATQVLVVYVNGATRLTSAALTFKAGDWLDILVTLDFANDVYRMYVNAALEDVDTTALIAPTLTSWVFGANLAATGLFVAGAVAEYAVFDRVLTATEVAILFAEQRPLIDCAAIENRPTVPGVSVGVWEIISSFTSTAAAYTEIYQAVSLDGRITFAGSWVCGLIQFEVSLDIAGGVGTGYVKLQYYDTTNAAWRDIPGSELSTALVTPNRMRTPPLVFPKQEYEYRVAAWTTAGAPPVVIRGRGCKIIVSPGGDYDNL